MQNPFVSMVLVVLVVLSVTFGIYREWQRVQKRARLQRMRDQANRNIADEKRLQTEIALTTGMNQLAAVFARWTEAQADDTHTKLMAGTLKACESIAVATVELKEAVKSFQALVAGPARQAGYPEDNVKPPATEDEAEMAARSFENILRGIPVAEAEAEAREAAEKKMMISATSLGMEE